MSVDIRHSVSAADLIRNFGKWQDCARIEPVLVTHRGRNSHVLLSAEGYEQLASGVANGESHDVASANAATLLDEMIECVVIVDEDLKVVEANRAARNFVRRQAGDVIGRSINELLPQVEAGMIPRYLSRTLRVGEHLSGHSHLDHERDLWIHFQTVRVEGAAALIFRDVTDDMRAHHLADVKEAIVRAIEVDGSVGYARLTVRETVERCGSALLAMLDVTEEALQRVRFSSVLVARCRAEFVAALERVFAGEGPQTVESRMLARSGTEFAVRLSIVELRGAYASEGAVVIVTRHEGHGLSAVPPERERKAG